MKFFKKIIVLILTLEAKLIIAKYKPFIVAVTGSVGKTSTKDAIYSVLKKKGGFVRKSEKSMNSEIGLPLTIIGVPNAWRNLGGWVENIKTGFGLIFNRREYPDTLVLEIGADHPGDIKNTVKWLRPNISVITRISSTPVHVEFFKSPDDVFEEKAALVRSLKKGNTAILYSDNKKIKALAQELSSKGITVNRIDIQGIGLDFPMTAARAVGRSVGLSEEAIEEGLKTFERPKGRMNIISGINGSTIIDDSYNSSPDAVIAALDVLSKKEGRKIAVLGDMMELGKYSSEEHRKIGKEAARIADLLITVGQRSKGTALEAVNGGLPKDKVQSFDTSEQAGAYIKPIIQSGDVILVKGSQSVRTEKVVKVLMKEPERSAELLARQEKEWLAKE
jgi:UDP-N-acetylmuramoyl-tripeptide--D-alanyl-D-alanine ligase